MENSKATSRQLWALYCITKKDYRNENLSKEEAAKLISELGDKNYVKKAKAKKTLSDEEFEKKRRFPIYGLVFCLLMAYVAEHFFGIADITGAYLAGIILCNTQSKEYINRRVEITSYMAGVKIPFPHLTK